MKIILQIIGVLGLIGAIVAGFSSGKEWVILKNFSGYQKEQFTITGTRVTNGTDRFLQGQGESGNFDFAISGARYRDYSLPAAVGTVVTVYRTAARPSIAFQQESVNVIFAEDWRERSEVETSARSTVWLAALAMVFAISSFAGARFLARQRAAIETPARVNSETL